MSRGVQRLVGDYAALAGGELLAKIASLVAFAYLARKLGPDAYGAVELAVALVMVFGLVVDFGFGPIGAREVTRDPGRAGSLARHIPAARLLLVAVAAPIMAAIVSTLDLAPPERQLALLFSASLLAAPFTLNWLFQGLDAMRWVALAQALRTLVFAGLVVLLVGGPEDLWRVGAAEIAAAFALAGYFVAAARRHGVAPGLQFQGPEIGRLLREALPVGAGLVLWSLNQYLPTLLVATLVGGSTLAFFGGAHRVVMSLGTFVWLYFFNLYPSIVRSTEGPEPSFARLARHSCRAVAWLGIAAALAGTAVAEPLCRLVFGDAFAAAGAPLAILVWVLPVNLLAGHARLGLIGAGHQQRALVAQLAGAGATLLLGLALVPLLAATGAALTMVASALVAWAVAHVYARQLLGPLPFAGPLVRPGLAAAAAAGAFTALSDPPWLGAAVAVSLYTGAAALLERGLMRDLRTLGRPAATRPASGPQPGMER